MEVFSILSVNIGAARPLRAGTKVVESGIFKLPVVGPLHLTRNGFVGDVQADLRNHGGPDKAVNVYPSEHFGYWAERLNLPIAAGAFGENLTVQGLLETDVAIGDVFRIGAALVQVTQPRQPCFKLGAKHGEPQLVKWVEETGYTGFYLRCLEEGAVAAGDAATRVERAAEPISIAEAYRIMHGHGERADFERLFAQPALSEAWRTALASKLRL